MRTAPTMKTSTIRRLTVAAAALYSVALLAVMPAGACAVTDGPAAARAAQSQSGLCTALIRNSKGKYVTVRASTLKYRYKRIRNGVFRRTIVRVKVAVRVSCVNRCVRMARKRGKLRPVYATKTVKVKVKRGNRIVTVKRKRRVYRYTKCPETAAASEGTPVRVDVIDGSYAELDFGSFKRQAPISGTLRGFVPGRIQLQQDIQLTLNRGTLNLGQTSVFIDDECAGQVSAAIRTGRPTTVTLDPARQSISTLLKSGVATATAYTIIRLPLELRNGDSGCNRPYISTGYREFKQTFFLRGKVGPDGLTKLRLTSAPTVLDVEACLEPGSPTQPCSGFAIPLPILVSTNLVVSIDLSGN